MVKLIKLLTIFLLINVWIYEVNGKINAKGIFDKASKGYKKGYQKFEKAMDKLDQFSKANPGNTDDVLILIRQIFYDIEDLNYHITKNKEDILEAIFSMKNFISIELEMNEFQKNVNEIKARFDRMKILSENSDDFEDSTKRAFAEWNVTPGAESVSSRLLNIFFTYFGYQNVLTERATRLSLLEKIILEFQYEERHNLCPPISAQQYFYSDYLEMSILEMKGYLINKYSWTLLRKLEGTGFRSEEHYSRLESEKRLAFMTSKLRNITAEATREIRMCDPDKWNEKQNFEQLNRFIQGYIVNEVNLNADRSCGYDCRSLQQTKVYKCFDNHCYNDKGEGNIFKCESETNKDFVTICPSDNPARRYKYFETNRDYKKDNNFYGERGSCPKDEFLIKSWNRGLYKCSYCFCLIADTGKESDRFFNLREVVSDVAQNKVVTGVRFIKKNRIMYLQIQQGVLGSLGSISKNSLEWKSVEEYALKKENHNIDYISLQNNRKNINLDSIIIEDPNYLVTGVKFSVTGSSVCIKVRMTNFNFESGIIMDGPTSHIWFSSEWDHKNKITLRGREPNRGPMVSINSPGRSIPSEEFYDVIEFTYSDKKSDASQTTLPFFDSQDVASKSPTPLAGIGLYHKGFKGYGGFLALKIITIDFSEWI